jgi:hypothetical protein
LPPKPSSRRVSEFAPLSLRSRACRLPACRWGSSQVEFEIIRPALTDRRRQRRCRDFGELLRQDILALGRRRRTVLFEVLVLFLLRHRGPGSCRLYLADHHLVRARLGPVVGVQGRQLELALGIGASRSSFTRAAIGIKCHCRASDRRPVQSHDTGRGDDPLGFGTALGATGTEASDHQRKRDRDSSAFHRTDPLREDWGTESPNGASSGSAGVASIPI